ncbi:MAG: type II toxin-antitoxin system VapC family toxin [Candidatus Rokubacteria bacterium]|nr:type II toxin-antitoxin system VapC family toxin [Candidatus Rokubacteria bacterium]
MLIDEFKRQSTVLVRIPRPQRATSPVAVWEFVHLNDGRLIAHAERLARKAWMDRQQIESVWFAPGSAQSFQTLLWHASCPPGVADCLLAAESLCRKWPLVTRNTKHFDDVQGMLVVPY